MHSTEPSTGGSQRRADRRVLLVEYFLAGDQLMTFGVRADLDEPAVSVYSIDQQELQRFVQANFGGGNRVRDLLDLELDELWHFYDFLVAPVGQWAAPGDIVYLIPHGLLHYLPLHALRIDDLYLAERNPVVYGPSAAVLKYVVGRRARGRRPSRATVFGDSRLNLPSARAEAVALAAALGTEPVLGAQVTRDNFVQRIEGADIVHFAGHAQVHADDAGGAGLQLAGQDVLSATEVLGLPDLDAAIVTLSGCETGVNERAPGDELMGLTRGFLYAGASSVLVSLWEVADESTEVLMRTFYGLLLDNPDMLSVDALQQAMLSLKADSRWATFYHWAPFVLIGDWR